MTKNELKSTTHGGGRVLSVILAGTLALGMTPAVSLTSQTLEPVQAFAAANWTVSATTSTQSPIYNSNPYTVTIAVTDGDNNDAAVTTGWSASVTGPDGKSVTVNGATFQATAAGTYSITVTEESDSSEHTASFEIAKAPVTLGGLTQNSTAAVTQDAAQKYVDDNVKVLGINNTELSTGYTLTAGTVGAESNGTQDVPFTISVTDDNYTVPTNGANQKITVTVKAQEKTNLATSFPVFTYDGTALANNFVVTVPSDSDLSTELGKYETGTTVTLGQTNLVTAGCTLSVANGKMTITGDGANYTNSYSLNYAVDYEFGDDQVELSQAPLTYNGKAQAPTITVTDPATDEEVAEGDYTVSYQKVDAETDEVTDIAGMPTDAGKYNVVVTYDGQQGVQSYTIQPQSISDTSIVTVTAPEAVTYTGSEIAVPAISVSAKYGEDAAKTLVADTDYTVEAPADTTIKDAGSYTLTIKGDGNYAGETTTTLTVNKANFSGVEAVVAGDEALVYTKAMEDGGEGVEPSFDVTFNGAEVADTEYNVSPSKITKTGNNIAVTLTAESAATNFTGSKQTTVKVLRGIDFAELVDPADEQTPTKLPAQTWGEGDWQKPAFQLIYDGDILDSSCYTVTYGENNVAGDDKGTVTVAGNPAAGWGGTQEFTYDIDGIEARIDNVETTKAVYDGTVQDPADFVTFDVVYKDADNNDVVVDPKDYTASIKTNYEFKNAQTYGLEITLAAGQYEVPAYTGTIEMDQANLADLDLKTTADQYVMTENEDGTYTAKPAFEITLNGETYKLADAEYTMSVTKGAVNAPGDCEATVTGQGNFKGDVDVAFNVAKDINNVIVTAIDPVTYNGEAQTPEFKVYADEAAQTAGTELLATEGEGEDAKTNYTVEWKNNIDAGTGQLVLTGKGDYAGTKTIDFTINKAEATMEIKPVAEQTYTGNAIMPEVVATVTAGEETFTPTLAYNYVNNTNVGEATIVVVPVGVAANYDIPETTAAFKIVAADIANAAYAGDTTVDVNKQPTIKLTYNGKELVSGTDFDVTETPVTSKAGKATLKVTGKGNFTGVKTIEITVKDASTPVNPDKPTTTEGWKQNSTGWWYETGEGSYVTSAWKEINGAWYHFNAAGYMQTGWQKINGAWYYLNKKGQGTEGAMQTGWFNDNGTWYYLNKKGEGTEGKMATGWKKVAGTWYYFNKSGAMQTGWQKVNGAWYYMAASGAMQTGWINLSGTWYYLNANGDMVSNQWKQINGNWFYFYASGAMAANTWVGNYWVDANGYWVR